MSSQKFELPSDNGADAVATAMAALQSRDAKAAVRGAQQVCALVQQSGDADAGAAVAREVLPAVVGRLNDAKEAVRKAALDALLVLVDVLSPQAVFDGAAAAMAAAPTKAWHVREETMRLFVLAVAAHGPSHISFTRAFPLLLANCAHAHPGVREMAALAMETMYRYSGDSLVAELSAADVSPRLRSSLIARFATIDVHPASECQVLGTPNKDPLSAAPPPPPATGFTPSLSRSLRKKKHARASRKPARLAFDDDPPPLAAPAPPPAALRPVVCRSDRDLAAELDALVAPLADAKTAPWNNRVAAMERLQALVAGGATDHPSFAAGLAALRAPLAAQLSDLRSKVTKAACATLEALATALGPDFESYADFFVPHLFKLLPSSKAAIAEPADAAICHFVTSRVVSSAISRVIDGVTGKSSVLRRYCAAYMVLILDTYRTDALRSRGDAFSAAIAAAVADAQPQVRASGRSAYWAFHAHFPSAAARLHARFDSATQGRIAASQHDRSAVAPPSARPHPPRAASTPSRLPPRPASAATPGSSSASASASARPSRRRRRSSMGHALAAASAAAAAASAPAAAPAPLAATSDIPPRRPSASSSSSSSLDRHSLRGALSDYDPRAYQTPTKPTPVLAAHPHRLSSTAAHPATDPNPGLAPPAALRPPSGRSSSKRSSSRRSRKPQRAATATSAAPQQPAQHAAAEADAQAHPRPASAVVRRRRKSRKPARASLGGRPETAPASTGGSDENAAPAPSTRSSTARPGEVLVGLVRATQSSEWMRRVEAFRSLRVFVCEHAGVFAAKSGKAFEQVMRAHVGRLDDPHHKVVLAAMASVGALLDAAPGPMEAWLDALVPLLLKGSASAKSTVAAGASSLLALLPSAFTPPTLVTAMVRALGSPAPVVRNGAVSWLRTSLAEAKTATLAAMEKTGSVPAFIEKLLPACSDKALDTRKEAQAVLARLAAGLGAAFDKALASLPLMVQYQVSTVLGVGTCALAGRPSPPPASAASPSSVSSESSLTSPETIPLKRVPFADARRAREAAINTRSASGATERAPKAKDEKPPGVAASLPRLLNILSQPTRAAEHATALRTLAASVEGGSVPASAFGQVFLVLSDVLGRTDAAEVRHAAVLGVRALANAHADVFATYAGVGVQALVEAYVAGPADGAHNVAAAATAALHDVLGALPASRPFDILTPLIHTHTGPVLCLAIRLLSDVVPRTSRKHLTASLRTFLPGLLDAFQNPSADVRKAVVFTLVETYMVLGAALMPHLSELSSSQLKLVTIYINRRKGQRV